MSSPRTFVLIATHSRMQPLWESDYWKARIRRLEQGDTQWIANGCYRIVSLVGRGGYGVVFRARQIRTAGTCAIKFLPIDPHAAEAFHREARLSAQIVHPNVVRVWDCDIHRESGAAMIVMEYLKGQTLRSVMNRHGALKLPAALRITRQIAAGLEAAHEVGLLHLDLKPSNVMVQRPAGIANHVVVMDFGLARPMGDATRGLRLGTRDYMAPEQWQGTGATRETDVFGLASICYELLAGRKPYTGENSAERMTAKLAGNVLPLDDVPSAARRPKLHEALVRALSLDPQQRPASPLEFADELLRLAAKG